MRASDSLWSRVEPLIARSERPSRYIDHEYGVSLDSDAPYRVVLVYPDTYELGQANQGLAILYHILNELEGVAAQRSYVPWQDLAHELRAQSIPLFSLEGCEPLGSFDLVGITLPHELACTNVLEVLDLAHIPLHSEERTLNHPLVIGGGPCAYNPEPVAPFFDAIVIGEGEDVICEVVDVHRRLRDAGTSRAAVLRALADIEGVYVPSLYAPKSDCFETMVPVTSGVPPIVLKRVVQDFDATAIALEPIMPFTEVVHDRFAVEILRGCTRGCRFCQAGMIYRPVRERSADSIVSATTTGLACTGYDEASLTSLSTTDHSQIEEILRRLNRALDDTGISISIPSQRLDAFGVDMAHLVAGGGKKGGLTFAPEAGTQRMRDIINKNVTEEDLLYAVAYAYKAGWRRCKLYFMIGLPEETDEDVIGIAHLATKAYNVAKDAVPDSQRGNVRMGISVAVFVPKSHTPFQWDGQIPPSEVDRRIELLRTSHLHRGIDFSYHDASTSYVEAALSRGSRAMAPVIERAWRNGSVFDAWTEHFSLDRWMEAARSVAFDITTAATRTVGPDEPLPWDHISCGVSKAFLLAERKRASQGVTTPDCSFTTCSACGVCPTLDVGVVLGGDSRG